MIIYCTTCCKEKRTNNELLKAIDRYISNRIQYVYNKSKQDGTEFRILSGKYGLLKAEDLIEWYDKKLESKDTPGMSETVKQQLIKQDITSVIFFGRNKETNPDWKPYYEVIENACNELEIKLEIKRTE